MGKANRALIKINGSLEENLGKFVEMTSCQDQETREPPLTIPDEQKKFLETAMDAVAHDIRNPLMVIGGFAQRIMKKGHEQGEVVQYAELIAQESHRLEKVLNDLMESASSL
jgi:signal transduction histidine kinase